MARKNAVYDSAVMTSTYASKPIGFEGNDGERRTRVRHTVWAAAGPIDAADLPTNLVINSQVASKFRRRRPLQFIRITDGLPIISATVRDVLNDFDIGPTQILPLTTHVNGKPSDEFGEFFLINVIAKKDSFVPEQSSGFEEAGPKWRSSIGLDKPVLRSDVALRGYDLWSEKRVSKRIYFSAPLAQALKAAKITGRDFSLRQCTLICD